VKIFIKKLLRIRSGVNEADIYDDSQSINVAKVDIRTGNVVTHDKTINENLISG